ncbi:winged helix family transcriptional regulator [Jiangella aurantiaca]|uniref:Winged helix family transcriptional regulator n=1 Tax=Jiangella aurantiaca TaxID=2530373 RepID=A0A4R5A0K6_9ACTN|nr:winged helix-turn-helix domain-containing protein [Jiangella aurantiaca]TDD64144.1 winged helix family transcriptional regulator [Jiangella aurantiaca]
MVSAAPYIETITPFVICVGTTPEDSTAIALAIDRRAIVMIAPDTEAARRLLVGDLGVPDSPAGVEDLETRVIKRGCLRVDLVSRQVTWGEVDIALSAREFDLLATLATEAGRVWTFEELMARIWKTRYLGDADPVVSAVKRLRRRLALVVDELRVVSVRGVGFRLVVPD